MTKRELSWGVVALLAGAIAGALLVHRFQAPSPTAMTPVVADIDAAVEDRDSGEPMDDDAALDGSADFMEPDASGIPPRREASTDAVTPPSKPHARPSLVERNLLVRPGGYEGLCMDAPSRGPGLQLFPCHGRKNQRWTFAEDPNGTSVISGTAGCLRAGRPAARGESTVEVGACGPDASRFRHTDDRRLEDVHSGLCVTAHQLETHAPLVLTACNPSRGGQTWSLSP